MKRLKLLLNIGAIDNQKLGLSKTMEGDVVSVDDDKAKILLARGWAGPVDGESASATRETDADEEDDDRSPLAELSADEAIEKIGRMRSTERLQETIDTDTRVSVQRAAQERLTAIQSGQ